MEPLSQDFINFPCLYRWWKKRLWLQGSPHKTQSKKKKKMKEIVENIIPPTPKTYQKKVTGLTFPSRSAWWYRNRPGLCSLWRHSSFQKTYKTEKRLDDCLKLASKHPNRQGSRGQLWEKRTIFIWAIHACKLYNIGCTIEENTVNWPHGPLRICMTSHICYIHSNISPHHAHTSHSLSRLCSREVR